MAEGISKTMGEKWPQVRLSTALGLLQTENSLGQVHSALFSAHAVTDKVGYGAPGRDDRHCIVIHANIWGFLSFLHFKFREESYSAVFLWREGAGLHEWSREDQGQRQFSRAGECATGQEQVLWMPARPVPLQTDFPLPNLLVPSSPHKKPQPLPWDSHHLDPRQSSLPVPTVLPCPSRQVPALPAGRGRAPPPCRGTGVPSPPDPAPHSPRTSPAAASSHSASSGRPIPGEPAPRGTGTPTAAAAPPPPSPASSELRIRAAGNRWEPLGTAGNRWELPGAADAPGTSGCSAPSCARTGARPAAPPARAERSGAEGC